MKRRLIKRNKQKISALLLQSRSHDMYLQSFIEIKKRYNETKRSNRLEKSHGEYQNWNAIEYDDDWLVVPICSKKTNEIFSYQIFFEKNQLPINKKHLFKKCTFD